MNCSINILATMRGEESFVNSFRAVYLHCFQHSTPGFKSSQYWNASENFDATLDSTARLNIRGFKTSLEQLTSNRYSKCFGIFETAPR